MAEATPQRLPTGVPGLDEVLHGGLIANRAFLVRGGPGTGKSTLGLQFLLTGARAGEKCLLISLKETEAEIRANAASLGFDLAGVDILDLSPSAASFAEERGYDLFAPAEVERAPVTRRIIERIDSLRPQRVVADAVTSFRYFAADAYQFRTQVLSFLRYLTDHGATVLAISEYDAQNPDTDLQFMSEGIINLDYGPTGRSLSVLKYTGSDFEEGVHSLKLTSEGMRVFPRLVPAAHHIAFTPETISSGVPALDELLHGGLERGTVTVVSGPTGVGKTTIGLQFMKEAAGRGERSVVYSFEEAPELLTARSESVNIPIRAMTERGTLAVVKVEPLEYTPDEFASLVRAEVEQRAARVVMIDSLSGYRLSIQARGEDLVSHLHALAEYLSYRGVTAILTNEVEYVTGQFRATELGISYMADNIIFLRYIEVGGTLRRAIGVLKKRLSSFEQALREFEITRYGIKVGPPLCGLRGILTGMPEAEAERGRERSGA